MQEAWETVVQATDYWRRLVVYLERLGVPNAIQTPARFQSLFPLPPLKDIVLPEGYLSFIQQYGFPTLYIDEDICLGFLPVEQSFRHTLYAMGVYPFAVCSPDCSVGVGFIVKDGECLVAAFEGLELIDIEGTFEQWIGMQVRQFLRQLMHYNIEGMKERVFTVTNDPLLLLQPDTLRQIS